MGFRERRSRFWTSSMAGLGIVLGAVFLAVAQAQGPALTAPPPTGGHPLLEANPGQALQFSVGDRVQAAQVTREGLVGSSVELRRSSGRLVGTVGDEPVEMTLEPHRLDGHIGDSPIGLDVIRHGTAMQIMGRFGSRLITVDVQPSTIYGQVGPCWYQLVAQPGGYAGHVDCGGQPRAVRLTVPVSFIARPDTEIAAMLTALLAR